jgi:choline-glycine betaine transporter
MIAGGRTVWSWVWVAILILGVLGFVPAIQWGRTTHWRNLDEVLRGAGTLSVSIGMLVLLQTQLNSLGLGLLVLSLVLFIAAFLAGKRTDHPGGDEP